MQAEKSKNINFHEVSANYIVDQKTKKL